MLPEDPAGGSLALENKPAAFPATHWSVVLAARAGQDTEAEAALETLCRAYWYPLYAYLRREGRSEPDAQDLVQGFFEHLLAHRALDRVAREKGRFRSFLLASLKYYVADQRAREQRQKRGGGQQHFSLDALTAEERYRLEPKDNRTPEQLFERRWVLALLDRVLARLREEYAGSGCTPLFQALEPFLVAKEAGDSYGAVAARLQRSEAAIQKAVQRMRRRYQELVRGEIAQTVSTPDEVEDELRHFCDVMSSG